jgi:hypothetical protein
VSGGSLCGRIPPISQFLVSAAGDAHTIDESHLPPHASPLQGECDGAMADSDCGGVKRFDTPAPVRLKAASRDNGQWYLDELVVGMMSLIKERRRPSAYFP